MKYIANPVEVDAFKIEKFVAQVDGDDGVAYLENGAHYVVTAAMTARMAPQLGDYYVIQSDGYAYLNPKEIFERKYSPAPPPQHPSD